MWKNVTRFFPFKLKNRVAALYENALDQRIFKENDHVQSLDQRIFKENDHVQSLNSHKYGVNQKCVVPEKLLKLLSTA